MQLTTSDIDRILRRNPKTRYAYKGCFPSNELPRPRTFPAAMVANFDDSSRPGTHWVALYSRTPYHVYYFDSLGLGSDYIQDIRDYIQKNYLTSTQQHFRHQRPNTDVCGHYALFFLYCCIRGIPLLQMEGLLYSRKNSDTWVRNFVYNRIMKGL
jgi:hypothetical protein